MRIQTSALLYHSYIFRIINSFSDLSGGIHISGSLMTWNISNEISKLSDQEPDENILT
jgi:hypothetical protein